MSDRLFPAKALGLEVPPTLLARADEVIGPRNIRYYAALRSAADYIEAAFSELGYSPVRQSYEARGKTFDNIIAERRGHMFPSE